MMRIVTWSRRTETRASSHWLCNNKTEHHERAMSKFGFSSFLLTFTLRVVPYLLYGHSPCHRIALLLHHMGEAQAKNDGPHIIKDNKTQQQPEILFFSMTHTEIRFYLVVQYLFVLFIWVGCCIYSSYPSGWIPLGKIWHSCEKTRRRHTGDDWRETKSCTWAQLSGTDEILDALSSPYRKLNEKLYVSQ